MVDKSIKNIDNITFCITKAGQALANQIITALKDKQEEGELFLIQGFEGGYFGVHDISLAMMTPFFYQDDQISSETKLASLSFFIEKIDLAQVLFKAFSHSSAYHDEKNEINAYPLFLKLAKQIKMLDEIKGIIPIGRSASCYKKNKCLSEDIIRLQQYEKDQVYFKTITKEALIQYLEPELEKIFKHLNKTYENLYDLKIEPLSKQMLKSRESNPKASKSSSPN